jgi:diguanylate cyclase (GGDEF)-like protein
LDGVSPVYPCFSSAEVVTAISEIQKEFGKDGGLHLDYATLNQRMQATLANSGNASKSLSSRDWQNIEIYGKFFETIVNEIELSAEIKSYLEGLRLPLLALPLQGENFLETEQHPVRKILNSLVVLDSALTGNKMVKETHIKKSLDKLLAKIAEQASSNPHIFSDLEPEFAGLAKQITKSIELHTRRTVETYAAQQKLEIATRTVQQEIDKRIAGKAMPIVIPRLLQAGWQQLLIRAELNNEKYQDEKLKYLTVIDDLIFWLYEQESVLKIQSGYIQKTLNFIDENLVSVCSNIAMRHAIIAELSALLLGVGNPKIRKPVQTVKIPPAVSAEQSSMPAPDEIWCAQVEQLAVGDWLSILSCAEGFLPMKLVWIGDILQMYVFISKDGLQKQEFNKLQLADLLRAGSAYKIENLDLPLMDRATSLMLQKMHEKLLYNATHDPVTELLTRDELVKQLKNEVLGLDNLEHMLCHIEVLDYRVITNICGVAGGNQLLKQLTMLMKNQIRNHDLLARLGDKSFAILFKDCSTAAGCEIAAKLVKIINDAHFQWQEDSFAIGVSVGLVSLAENSFDIQRLLQQADAACLSAERAGQNRVLLYTDEDENLQHQHKLYGWIGRIDNIFAENRLFARCQKIVPADYTNNQYQHYEILLGVRDEAGGIIAPDNFIPAVERCKRMPEIDRWIFRNVFAWIEQNSRLFEQIDGFSINLSGQSINSAEFLEFLSLLLESSSVPYQKLTFEITETVAAQNLFFTKKFIKAIKQFGCKFSLDDFGSGFSSYAYLKNLNVDYLKIDGAFIKDIANNKADVAIVTSMNEIAHSLGLKTIAEYVENAEIREILKQIGVDYVQGYGIQKPIPLADLVKNYPAADIFKF